MEPSSPKISELRQAADARAAALARRFGDALRVGDGRQAELIVDEALSAEMAPAAVQVRVIGPSMVRIGELWESGAIGVADEHLATAISDRALIRLFEAMTATRVRPRSRERVLLAAVEGQRHVLGLRMIADVLEAAGFDVLNLGADVPAQSLRRFVIRHRPAVAGLAYGIAGDAGCLADALAVIEEVAPATRIMLGGRAVPPALAAAGYPLVTSSLEVVDVVDALLAGAPQSLPTAATMLEPPGGRIAALDEDSNALAESLAGAAAQAGDVAREHVRRAEAFREIAFREPLTELEDRRAFEDGLHALARPDSGGGALLIVDVDGLRRVNGQRGEQAGDALLRALGGVIAGELRDGDVAGRTVGDVFAILLPGATVAVACERAARIRAIAARLAEPIGLGIGVAEVGDDARKAMLAASTALYEAKRAGGDRVVAAGEPRSAG